MKKRYAVLDFLGRKKDVYHIYKETRGPLGFRRTVCGKGVYKSEIRTSRPKGKKLCGNCARSKK